ncbi:MAG: molybdopterin cofactor-binding domain-containing protein, partial [Pseudomonadota bacterium]
RRRRHWSQEQCRRHHASLRRLTRHTWRAFRAIEEVEIDWAPVEAYPAEQADHWATLEASFTEDKLNATWRSDGDTAAALTNGASVEAEYRAPYVAHQPLEPLNAIARVTDASVEIWTGHQMPRFLQMIVAGITGHDADQVIFHNQYSGGSFGHRLEFEQVKLATEIANAMRGTPVKLTFSREEDFAQDFPRQISLAKGRGTVSGGQIETIDLEVAAPSVIGSQFGRMGQAAAGPDSQVSAGAWNAPYTVTNFHVKDYATPGLSPVSSWRSVGASTGGFFIESLVDELAHAAGADPMAERLRLAADEGTRAVLETVSEMSGWGRELPPNHGLGVAMVKSFGVPTAEVVEVAMTDAGLKLVHVWVAAEVGRVVDPINFENHVQGGVIWGLGHAMNSEITFADGAAEQTNYHAAEGLRIYQTPPIDVRGVEIDTDHVRGIGEPPVPPAAPALANAIFAATGQRLREMPFNKFIDFV